MCPVGSGRAVSGTHGSFPSVLRSCCILTLYLSALKRTKAYESLTDVRPTIRNKPAGLVNNWYEAATTPPPPQTSPPMHSYAHDPFMLHPMSQSHMGESSQFSLHQPFGQFQPIPTQVAGSLFSQPVDPMPLTFAGPDNSPWAHPVNPSLVRRENTVNEMEQARNSLSLDAALSHFPSQVISLPRPYINKDGEKRAVGIQDLPNAVRVGFRDSYIRRVIKLVFSSDTPWANPSIDVLQQEFNASFPNHCVKMHLDDAAAFPVCTLPSSQRNHSRGDTDDQGSWTFAVSDRAGSH